MSERDHDDQGREARDDQNSRAELISERERRDLEGASEPPVVARLVVEIRSDGSRTIARGALEDRATGQSAAIEARGDSPMSLALALARSLFKVPSIGRTTARALLGRRRRDDD